MDLATPPCVAVLGPGEAGTAIVIDLRDAGVVLDVPPRVRTASRDWLEQLATDPVRRTP